MTDTPTMAKAAGCCCLDGLLCGACGTGHHFDCPDSPDYGRDDDDAAGRCPECDGSGEDFEGGTCTLCGGWG